MEKLRVEGDAYERGLQQGRHFGPKALQDAKHALADLHVMPKRMPRFLRRSLADGVVTAAGRLHYGRHRAALERHAGGKLARGLKGLAEGFGTTPMRVYGFAAFEIESARFKYTLGCTSLAFAAGATQSGRPLIAYNHDFPPELAGFPFIRESVPDEGFPNIAITYPALLGCLAGVNAAGLAVSLNHAWPRRLSSNEAVPISWLVQDALERCATVSEAIALFESVHVPNGSMATFADVHGDRAALELTPAGVFVRRSNGPVLHTFNAYQTDGARRLEVPIGAIGAGPIAGMDIHGPNLGRQTRFDALGAAYRSGWTEAQIDALLADHGESGRGSVNTICRHDDAAAVTLLTARIDPVLRTLSVGSGHACTAVRETFGVPVGPLKAAA